ncbi:hypothetical protein A2765_01015 [Candidatus Kaiserbacteria bacterium RIFCSPHIGHO2_01_FULL_56_24]|uniref:DUF5666 domain-containing protein n=1 Tax=Candidatus Kaiserbacteria bacterium RIFCSPHIGHO2_01_FULL_56_24 TaxID=1798487 RepID=A0A1F6DGH0_9BACT|nr:MAG: hypothetical protein A2765_01015 [Candidatus Kaiserbacteria bacterium RIFCSPHIGHO2_01_FULL_56_24]
MAMALIPFASVHADTGNGVEVNIGANGNALVRGAKVTAVSGSQVNANTNYGSSILSWIVKTDGSTKFTTNKGSGSGLANIAVGDIVSFNGALDQTVAGLTVNAKVLKDWTQVESKKTYSGIVTSINATLNSFMLGGNSTTTVQTNSATKFKLSNGNSGSFADLFLNAKVKVMGMLNASSSIFTATSIDIGTTSRKHYDDKNDNGLRGWFRGNFWLNLWNR